MSESQVSGLMGETLEKIKSMVNVDTVMGTQINTPDGTTVIPICKVNYGFASGGSDIPTKVAHNAGSFGGGSGGSVSIAPIAFLVIKNGDVKILQIEPFTSSVDRIIEKAPDVVDKITGFFNKSKDEETEE